MWFVDHRGKLFSLSELLLKQSIPNCWMDSQSMRTKRSAAFCYIWSSYNNFRFSNHTQVIATRPTQVKSRSNIVKVMSQRALKSPNHWEWWLSSDSNHESLESLWLRTNSAIQYYENFTKITRLSSLKIYVTWKFSACLYLRIFSWTKLGWIGLKVSSQSIIMKRK